MYRDPRLRGLSSEHHQALVLGVMLKKAGKSGDPEALREAAKTLAERFPVEIDPHFRTEEDVLLPALRARGKEEFDLIERTEVDHAYLRAGAERARAGDTDHLEEYGTRMVDHVRFEEKELFERCQNVLPDAVLEEVWHRCPKD